LRCYINEKIHSTVLDFYLFIYFLVCY
jgi:hypothetical protein